MQFCTGTQPQRNKIKSWTDDDHDTCCKPCLVLKYQLTIDGAPAGVLSLLSGPYWCKKPLLYSKNKAICTANTQRAARAVRTRNETKFEVSGSNDNIRVGRLESE